MWTPTYKYDYLCHHGILGMKWGKKNGPPYPLDAEDHSQSEKKAGYQRSIKGRLTDEQKEKIKKAAKIAAISAGTIVATYAGYKIATNPQFRAMVSQGINTIKGMNTNQNVSSFVSAGGTSIDPKTGFNKITNFSHDITQDFKGINPNYNSDGFHMLSDLKDKAPLDRVNCVACTTTYEAKCRGLQVVAQLIDTRKMEAQYLMNSIYKDCPSIDFKRRDSYGQLMKELASQGNGARGNLFLPFEGGGAHSVAYEVVKGKFGGSKVLIMDCQMGKQFKSIKDLSKALVEEAGGNPGAAINEIPFAGFIRTDNLEFNDISVLKTLIAG